MPGWGTGSFENEDAQNFLGSLNALGIDDLRPILVRAADQDGYLEAAESSVTIVAAEIVAAMLAVIKNEPLSSTPHQIVEWISENRAEATLELVDLAGRAAARVRTNSELKDLWLEAEGLNEWSSALRDLEARLEASDYLVIG
jgi:hypothetical protein